MPDPIILSDSDCDDAVKVFNNWLKNEPVTLLVVLGDDNTAQLILEKANKKINSGSQSFFSVRVVHSIKPECIINILKGLKFGEYQKPINWNDYVEYSLLSISSFYNNIGLILKRTELNSKNIPGYINYAVLTAQASDK